MLYLMSNYDIGITQLWMSTMVSWIDVSVLPVFFVLSLYVSFFFWSGTCVFFWGRARYMSCIRILDYL